MVIVCLFGFYQWVGDFLGLPFWLTGMYATYSKQVFGVPRMIATALEPQYFAQMLFLPIFSLIFLPQKYIFNRKWFNLSVLLLAFLLTISKGGILILVILITIAAIFYLIQSSNLKNNLKVFKKTAFGLLILSLILAIVSFLNSSFASILSGIWGNAVATIFLQSGSAAERIQFANVANDLIRKYSIFGIGSGQYGIWANQIIKGSLNIDSAGYLITNNVYLEVWLEHGFGALLIFLIAIFYPIIKLFRFLKTQIFKSTTKAISTLINTKTDTQKQVALILLFSSLANYLQWLFFSPIYIMPIFIILGLVYNLVKTSQI
jgi:O-antigen ligase